MNQDVLFPAIEWFPLSEESAMLRCILELKYVYIMLHCKTFRIFTHVDNRDGDIGSGVSFNVSVFPQSEMGLTKDGPLEH